MCLGAALALSAIGAGSALALPEVGRCVSKAGAKYTNSSCTTKAKGATGSFEWEKNAVKVGFKASGGEAVLETEGGTKIACKTQSAEGKFLQKGSSTKEVTGVVARFHGCEAPVPKSICQSKGASAGEIVTNPLKGPLGYISGEKTASPVVGQELTPVTKKGHFVDFECGGGEITIAVGEGKTKPTGDDALIGTLSSVNVMTSTVGETFSAAGGEQLPHKFEKSSAKAMFLEVSSNGGIFERATQTGSATITTEEPLEIKA
jgi:hypothetical protein